MLLGAFLRGYILLCLYLGVSSADLFTPSFWPAQIPLAVRSPYFSAWQPATSPSTLLNDSPRFWYDKTELGWQGMIRVDGQTWTWLGGSENDAFTANLTDFQLTPTQTIFKFAAGTVNVTATFLTPIEASDWVRQSMPFTYVSLVVSSNDGKDHTVQVYCDISAQWLSSNSTATVQWSTTATPNGLLYHQAELMDPIAFSEYGQLAQDGTLYMAVLPEPNKPFAMSYMTGGNQTVRGEFVSTGSLPNTTDRESRAISDNTPVFAISYDMGAVVNVSSPMVWAIGYVRNPSIQYTTPSGETQLRYPYYASQYSATDEMIYAYLSDYNDALERSTTLDQQLLGNASLVSSEYSDLISLSARQGFGGIDITISNETDGSWDVSDTMIFMKDIGNSRRVNPVEVMYAAMPMFLYLNASYVGALLYPVLDAATSTNYLLEYAPNDIGNNYPTAGGVNNTATQEGVEQSGNMLIMALAHARATGDGSLISHYYAQFNQWANYLQYNAIMPQGQITADGQSTTNMTNLALKGIVGIRAMAEISKAVGLSSDASLYQNLSTSYYSLWQNLSMPPGVSNVPFAYGDSEGTWTLLYNLYADRLLGTDLVSGSIIEDQSAYYQNLINSGSGGPYGIPMDQPASTTGNSAWMAFAAAASKSSTRNTLFDLVWAFAQLPNSTYVFPTTYDVLTGALANAGGGQASPAQGAMFAPLALNLSTKSINIPASVATSTGPSSSISDIIGGVVGGVAGLIIIVLLGFCYWRRIRRHKGLEAEKDLMVEDVEPVPFPYTTVPASAPQGVDIVADESRHLQSSKLQRFLSEQGQTSQAEVPSSDPSTNAGPTERRSESQPAQPSQPSRPPNANPSGPNETFLHLRSEVDNLRRFMQEIRAERLEAPPSYFTE